MGEYEKEPEVGNEYTIDLLILIRNIWKGLVRFGWLVPVLSMISIAIACVNTRDSYWPYYKASATFTVKLYTDTGDGSMFDENIRAQQMSKTFPYIINSGILKNVIAQELGQEHLSESIYADNVVDTNLFTLNVMSSDPVKAYEVLQSVIRNYPKIAESVVGRTSLEMLDETGIPEEPVNSINYRSSIKLGALPGAFLGFGVVFLYAITRRTVYRTEDLQELSHMKRLGTLPKVVFKKRRKKLKDRDTDIVSIKNNRLTPGYRESMYRIRTRLERLLDETNKKVIMVTSAIPGEGKSTFAFNLALALGEIGKKVILVDCDLRHPSIKNMLQLQEETIGLDELILGEVKLTDALKYYGNLNVSIIAGTQTVDNAGEILSTLKMQEIIKELEKSADYVILDTAPSAILSDSASLAKYTDGIIFVVKQDYAKINHILEGLEHISESCTTEILGFVMNCMKAGLGDHGYGYGYGGYGRYGGYGHERA